MRVKIVIAALLAATTPHAWAAKTPVLAPVDFSACMNTSADYGQPRGSTVGNAGTTYSKLTFSLNNPSAGNNLWVGGANNGLTIRLSVKSPQTVYTMMSTWWGQTGIPNATVTFKFASGRHKKFNLIGDDDIRDYNQNVWTNNINGKTTQEWWVNTQTNTRLDVQGFQLGKKFVGETLTKIIVSAPADAASGSMQPVIFAIGIDAGGLKSVQAKCSAQ